MSMILFCFIFFAFLFFLSFVAFYFLVYILVLSFKSLFYTPFSYFFLYQLHVIKILSFILIFVINASRVLLQKSEDDTRRMNATVGHQIVNMGYDWPKEGLVFPAM